MDIKLIIAVIRRDKLEEVETRVRDMGVERVNVSKVKGYGEYHDFFARNWMVEEVRIEIFTKKEEVEAITAAVMDAAHTGLPGDGVVAVVPVERLYLVRTRSEATPDEFWPPRTA
ncbi:MAG: P-II family nitrogen regulator [Betaproteobacteria bacterium]|nr:P-II family nitrogen regulator [Betaproteobacteria bacterium]